MVFSMGSRTTSTNTIFRISQYLFRYPGLFSTTLGLALGSTLFLIAIPSLIQFIIDHAVAQSDLGRLFLGIGFIAVCYFGRDFLNCLRIRVNNSLEQRVLYEMRQDLHSKLLLLPIGFYDGRKSGDIASRVIDDVSDVERALLDGTEQGSVALMTVVGILTLLFLREPMLATLVMLPIPVLILISIRHAKATRKNWRRVRNSAGLLNSLLVEDIQGNRLIQSFNLHQRERSRFHERAMDLRRFTLKAMFRYSIYSPSTSFIASLGVLAVIGFGGYLIIQDRLTYGQFIAFFAYAAMLNEPILRMSMLNQLIAAGRAAGDRVFEILDYPVDIESPDNPLPFPAEPLEVRFEGVSFSYRDRETVVRDLELTLPPGRVTAIVGHTGSGKSTVANLISRYYDVEKGRVSINGTDVRQLDLLELRAKIGLVSQDPFLFDATVRDNLLLAAPDADEASIREALEGACAEEFVDQLPQGLDTLIGERGVRLSMGERQRLTIARVILRNPPLLILDEATSSVDTLTEKKIQTALDHVMAERTTLVIAHRLSTVRKADRIIVLEKGRIIETGTPSTLICSEGAFSKLWNQQADFLLETEG